jgi:hypothetical protein
MNKCAICNNVLKDDERTVCFDCLGRYTNA